MQKTYIADCISKKTKKNNGELPMYYVENNHLAIIERAVFDRAQEELARRSSKQKVKQIGTKTELGKYSGKYALSELLFCGCCGTPYRRCTWAKHGRKKVVWRCISRLDYGTKYCKDSPTVEETVLHNAIARAITQKAQTENADLSCLQKHIELYQTSQNVHGILEKRNRLKAIQKRIDELTESDGEAAQHGDFDDQFESLYAQLYAIKDELEKWEKSNAALQTNPNVRTEVEDIINGLRNHPVEYNDPIVRQLVECIKVTDADVLNVYFKDGTEINVEL